MIQQFSFFYLCNGVFYNTNLSIVMVCLYLQTFIMWPLIISSTQKCYVYLNANVLVKYYSISPRFYIITFKIVWKVFILTGCKQTLFTNHLNGYIEIVCNTHIYIQCRIQRGGWGGAPGARPLKLEKIWFLAQNRDFSHETPQQFSRHPPLGAFFLSASH